MKEDNVQEGMEDDFSYKSTGFNRLMCRTAINAMFRQLDHVGVPKEEQRRLIIEIIKGDEEIGLYNIPNSDTE